ncbi:decaprenyl-phosphate phosphoribosyltransferase [Propionivibrio sp.]|uniref:decaprenyl-phosphate phosphoribosyltransferase n=1 Tax=Propionivibrio sp. TaxID=2212460 RepID=UPI0025E2FCD6|nr:decaprenyl-phosphate phosphoribosyltransferase [Propionivibrio sp.]MBK7355402.1 decaprenyl-phosphate phosphoribosyltransferase [Propionivibrio sp.]MBK8399807.1 decaprenyl-phosphate phosphoribosyltransferase [Propionivibrio sp.]MBK8743304.1 decaprenyl-phosphate phosphoribosyltransferase [Propionivibrio sp.]
MRGILPYLKLMRPHQWVKSGFVFVGLLFGHGWHDAMLVHRVLMAAAAFSLAASAVYIFNDLADREQDREHPEKRHRPLAAGTVGVIQALLLAGFCMLSALMLANDASKTVLLFVLVYALLNLAYSMGLKHIALLDVFIISTGFMLRILAGTLGVGIAPSHWLLLCSLLLTLFLGFAKRRAELNALSGRGGRHRRVLDDYSPVLLDKLISICAASAIVSYGLYTVSPETVAMHGTTNLIYSVPFVIYGIFRYLFLLHRRSGGGDPAAMLLQDYHLLGTFAAWFITIVALLA